MKIKNKPDWKKCVHKWVRMPDGNDCSHRCPICKARKDRLGIWHPDVTRYLIQRADGTVMNVEDYTRPMRISDWFRGLWLKIERIWNTK